MSLDKISKVVLDVKCVLAVPYSNAGAVKRVVARLCPYQRWVF